MIMYISYIPVNPR